MVYFGHMIRYLHEPLLKDLKKKMVFLGGPRQCGKTTSAKLIMKAYPSAAYLNWDFDRDRKTILKEAWDEAAQLVVFDELHKFPRWKNWIKGQHDVRGETQRFLVTGSARLDVFRRGGDSLLGRYHYWRLHPFSLFEIPGKMRRQEAFSRLMTVGGFPEPFLDGDQNAANRWRRERSDRILKDDVRDLEHLKNIQTLALFVDALRERVGGLVVLSNIAEDLQVSPKTLAHWLEVLERMYVVFVVRPYSKNIPRSLQKPPKVYFFDNNDVLGDDGQRFENLVATHLLKQLHFLEDKTGVRYELAYIRDKEGREVDFAIVKEKKLHALIEAKWCEDTVSKSLRYYAERLKPQVARQIVAHPKRVGVYQGVSVENILTAFAVIDA